MHNNAREKYNSSFSTDKYHNLLAEINSEFPDQLDFRVAETPVFVGQDLKIKILGAANEIMESILDPSFIEKTNSAIPENYKVPNENPRLDCLAIDFGIVKNNEGVLEPKLIELQGFPSLFAYQSYLSSKYKKHFDIDPGFSPFFNRLNAHSYIEEMREFLLGNSKPENVIILELFPDLQKTRLDFAISKAYWDINTICITKIIQRGSDIFYLKDENEIKIERIYNRLIFDDLEQNLGTSKPGFDLKSEINATWISHPNWFFRVSKYCMPFLKSKAVPVTKFLSDYDVFPSDLENYVLKPLFSFAGSGVKIDLKLSDLEQINDKNNYILQEKVLYDNCIFDTKGQGIKTEIRLLYIWPKNQKRPKLMTNLARLSKGKMIGVAFNKDFDWVGGSSAFFETN